jgi:hypothetical protein
LEAAVDDAGGGVAAGSLSGPSTSALCLMGLSKRHWTGSSSLATLSLRLSLLLLLVVVVVVVVVFWSATSSGSA